MCVEARLTESFTSMQGGQLSMRDTRCFSNASADHVLFLPERLKFNGPSGLMPKRTENVYERGTSARSRNLES